MIYAPFVNSAMHIFATLFLLLSSSSSYSSSQWTYSGHYTCSQGKTALQLVLSPKDESIDAEFHFATESNIKGSFVMAGSYMADGNRLTLRGVSWKSRPGAFVMVDLVGTFNNDMQIFQGQVRGPGCTDFRVILPDEDATKLVAEMREREARAEINRKQRLEKINADVAKLDQERKVSAEREAKERREAEAMAAEEERRYKAIFNRKGDPQAIYLRGGKFERDGKPDQAREIYEFLTEAFASSTWAVKANDRLLTMGGKPSAGAGSGGRSSGQPYPRLACVAWEIQWSTNPIFKNADIVKYQVQANFLESSGGQCEVKIRSQRRISLLSDRPPYKDNESIVIECSKLSPC